MEDKLEVVIVLGDKHDTLPLSVKSSKRKVPVPLAPDNSRVIVTVPVRIIEQVPEITLPLAGTV